MRGCEHAIEELPPSATRLISRRGANATSVSAKVILLSEMVRQKVRPAELARRLQTTPQEVNRLTNLHHTSRIDGIAGAMKALGKRLELQAL